VWLLLCSGDVGVDELFQLLNVVGLVRILLQNPKKVIRHGFLDILPLILIQQIFTLLSMLCVHFKSDKYLQSMSISAIIKLKTKMRQLTGVTSTRKACIGGIITYTTANGRTAWILYDRLPFL